MLISSLDGVRRPTNAPVMLHARRLLHETDVLESCFRLRHAYFVREKGWVEDAEENVGLENDAYDERAWHFACFDGSGVCAYLRALPWDDTKGFMLDREFAPLLTSTERHLLPREHALELSRLVLRPDITLRCCPEPHPLEHLLKILYQHAHQDHYARFYIVVEAKLITALRRRFGLPFRVIGQPHTFPDGTRTVAAVATLEELEAGVQSRDFERYLWFQTAPNGHQDGSQGTELRTGNAPRELES